MFMMVPLTESGGGVPFSLVIRGLSNRGLSGSLPITKKWLPSIALGGCDLG